MNGASGEQKPKGLLVGVEPSEVARRGINIFAADLSIDSLWSPNPPTGGALLDRVLAFYGVGTFDVPWYFVGEDGVKRRTIERSPLSRELQQATVQAYKERILKESISQVAAGQNTKCMSIVFCITL